MVDVILSTTGTNATRIPIPTNVTGPMMRHKQIVTSVIERGNDQIKCASCVTSYSCNGTYRRNLSVHQSRAGIATHFLRTFCVSTATKLATWPLVRPDRPFGVNRSTCSYTTLTIVARKSTPVFIAKCLCRWKAKPCTTTVRKIATEYGNPFRAKGIPGFCSRSVSSSRTRSGMATFIKTVTNWQKPAGMKVGATTRSKVATSCFLLPARASYRRLSPNQTQS